MKPRRTNSNKPTASIHGLRRQLEFLEDRAVPATVSIADATAIEGSTVLRSIDRFVAQGSGGILYPNLSCFGPDGNGDGALDLYVAGTGSDGIYRYDGQTGAFVDVFVTPGSGGLNAPVDLAFGPDGNLYVSSALTNQVLRYDGSTGAYMNIVAGGLSQAEGLMFGPDGSLYIANQFAHEVLRYQNGTLTTFVVAQSGGLQRPRECQFGPDGSGDGLSDLYVAGYNTSPGAGCVFRYDGLTGAYIDTFAISPAGMRGIAWLQFGSDGYLYTTVRTTTTGFNTSFVRYNAATGAFVDTYPLGRDGWPFLIGPDGLIYDGTTSGDGLSYVERFGHSSLAVFTVTLDAPSATPITVQYAAASGTAQAGSDFTATTGTLTFAPGQTTRTILVRTLDDAFYEGSETLTVNLSSAVGATITDGQAIGTITDDEPAVQISIENTAINERLSLSTFAPGGSYGLVNAAGVEFGADRNGDGVRDLYVVGRFSNNIPTFDGNTGTFIGEFVPSGSSGLFGAAFFCFGPEGDLFIPTATVSGGPRNAVSRFDGATGAWEGYFMSPGSGGLTGAKGIVFGPDGNCYIVKSGAQGQILRYDGTTGAFLDAYVGAVNSPGDVLFGPDGNNDGISDLYVSGVASNEVFRYCGATGAFLGVFATAGSGGLVGPHDMTFGSDGHLYVVSSATSNEQVFRFNGVSGEFIDIVIPTGSGVGPETSFIAFDNRGNLYVSSEAAHSVLRQEQGPLVNLSGPSSAEVTVSYSSTDGSALAGIDFVPLTGTLRFAPGEVTKRILLSSLDDTLYEGPETFTLNLSNPVGASISDGQAVGTITDNEPVLAQVRSIAVNGGAAQRSRVTDLAVTFGTQVTFATTPTAAFSLTRNSDGAAVTFTATASVVDGVTVVTLTDFSGVATQFGSLADGRYTLTALASQINAGGQPLDGNSDGTAGDDFVLIGSPINGLFRLFGDSDGNGAVTAADFNAFRLVYGTSGSLFFDFNDDGQVTASDFSEYRLRYGVALTP